MTHYLIRKPTVKDPKSNRYIGGKYEIVDDHYIRLCGSRLQQYQIIELSKNDCIYLGREGFYQSNSDGIMEYYQIVDPYKTYILDQDRLSPLIPSDTPSMDPDESKQPDSVDLPLSKPSSSHRKTAKSKATIPSPSR